MFRGCEDIYRSVVEDQTEVISRLSADGTFLFVNEVFCRFFGKTSAELLGKKWQPAALADDVPKVEAQLATLSSDKPVVVVENRIYSGSGALHWFQFVNRGFFDAEGKLAEIQCVGRDICALKHAEEARRRSEERLSLALSGSQMGVWEWEVQTGAIYWSPECFQLLDVENFTGTLESFTNSVHPEDVPRVMAAARRSLAEGTDFNEEFRIICSNGEVRWLSDRGRPSYDAAGAPVRLVGTVQDITERKRSQESLSTLHEKLSDLSAHLESVREQERLAISREIHDGMGQSLLALKLDLAWIGNRMGTKSAEMAERLLEMREGLDELLARAQHITAELRPPLLDNLGLLAAIEWQVRDFRRRSGIDCRFVVPESIGPIDGQLATCVIRILQEALSNVLRHARATEVRVSLRFARRQLEMEVSDNGCGITKAQVGSATAYGVMGMRERARLCHGRLEISGRRRTGTTVCLTVPLAKTPRSVPARGRLSS